MDASDGSREEKDDDHQSNRRKLNFDRLGCRNMEGSDEVHDQLSDQMEVVEDATGGRGRMFGNNDRVVENSNAEFIESQMDIRGSVGGQFGNELVQSSDTGNIESSSNGMVLDRENLLVEGTSGTQLVLHSESSDVLGQGQGQATDGTGSMLHSESSNMVRANMYSQSVTPAATQYQRGRLTVTHEQPSAIFGIQEHSMRVRSDTNMVRADMFRQGTPQVSQRIGFSGTAVNPLFPFASQNAGLPVARPPVGYSLILGTNSSPGLLYFSKTAQVYPMTPPVQSGTGLSMPQGVLEHNMRVPSDANMVRANMFRQGTPQMSQQIGGFGTWMNPFFPIASQNAGLPVDRPPVHMGISSNSDIIVEARERKEVVSDQGLTSEDS